MGVLLQGFYKKKPNDAVPSPADGDSSVLWWWDHLANQAMNLRQAGFTAIWLPPVLKTASGNKPGADGYGPFDDYDIGSKSQKGSTPTRFGSREQLQRCVAILRANGMDVYLDMVEHHRSGDTTPFVFRYPNANQVPDIGRFPKDPFNFIPQVPRDPNLGGPPADDAPFGRELAPINAKPAQYVFDNLINAADWLTRSLDTQGYRLDDVKSLSTDFLRPFLESKSMANKFAVGEFFDGNQVSVNGWVENPTGMQGRASAFDFPLKFILNTMCSNPGRFDMSSLDHAGLAGISPQSAVTFVENHDTDLSSDNIVSNKILAYAYILTSEGYPCVYYRDYSTDPDCYGMKPAIDNLIWIHEKLAFGPTEQRFKDFNIFAYERVGGPNLLNALNNDPEAPRTITVGTGFGPNVLLHDYTGHSADTVTDGDGNVTITIPANINGSGYVCYSRAGVDGGFVTTTLSVTQDFEGDADLDIPPALAGKSVQVGRIWCEANTLITVVLKPVTTDWTSDTAIVLELLSSDGKVLAQQSVGMLPPHAIPLRYTTISEGYHALRVTSSSTPATNASPAFVASVTYTAPLVLSEEGIDDSSTVSPGGDPAEVGRWSEVISLTNVPIHSHLLPTGKLLFWGRRNPAGNTVANADFASLNQHKTQALIWDPANPTTDPIPTLNQPEDSQGAPINLFCAGHTFLSDGRLMVTGGHLFDSQGIDSSTIYNPSSKTWTAQATMNQGRWYPTAVSLPNGNVLVCSGQAPIGPLQPPPNGNVVNEVPQVWDGSSWINLNPCPNPLPLFPRLHVAPDGRVFMSGPVALTFFLDTQNGGTWTPGPSRSAGNTEYGPSVMYDVGKVMFIGGGAPTNVVETIDLNDRNPTWSFAAPMKFARRQHNATLLPDGTILVTGGTKGSGGPGPGFNDLSLGEPVRTPELWSQAKGWTEMAPEAIDRCYHSTAVLLPDATVLSAGGGEYAPTMGISNPAQDTHANCQIFSPPYLFRGDRPVITDAPKKVEYGQAFGVDTPTPNEISQVTWIRLASVTHSFDQNQRINLLTFNAAANQVIVQAPPNSNVCPPGHYMLFLLNKKQVPSVAAIVQISAAESTNATTNTNATPDTHLESDLSNIFSSKSQSDITFGPIEKDAAILASEPHPPVVVGITPTCPYGITSCWAGAFEALRRLNGVRLVRPVANANDSTANVYLQNDGLPDLDGWPAQFDRVANGVHLFRGVEISDQGVAFTRSGQNLTMTGNSVRPALSLQPLNANDKIQWDATTNSLKPPTAAEKEAFDQLLQLVNSSNGSLNVMVTGPLKKNASGYVLQVRQFIVP